MSRLLKLVRSPIFACVATALACSACSAPSAPLPIHTDIERAEIARVANSPVLAAATHDADPSRRARAALALGRIQAPGDIGLLIPLLQDDDREVRLATVFAVGQQGLSSTARPNEKAIAGLESALSNASADDEMRARIIEALGKQASAKSESILAAHLVEDTAPEVRTQAAHGLMRRRFVPLWRGEVEEPVDWIPAASDALIAALGDEHDGVREAAVHALSRYPWTAAVPALSGMLADPTESVRVFAVRGIGRSGSAEDGETLTAALQDGSARVRYQAVKALAQLERAELLASSLMDDASPFVRSAYLAAVAGNDSPAIRELIRSSQEDPSATVRSAALTARAAEGNTEALAAIESHAKATQFLDRMAAADAATVWREAAAEKGGDPSPSRALLLRLAADPEANVVATALPGLRAWLDHEDVLERLDIALTDERLAVRGTAASMLDELNAADRASRIERCWQTSAGVEWVEVRETLVDALASLLEEETQKEAASRRLQVITRTDPQASVRDRAEAALSSIDPGAPETENADDATRNAPELAARWDPEILERFSTPPIVQMETTRGSFRIETYAVAAPIHTANFVDLVREGFYDGLLWHRVAPNFVVQGGDPTGTGWGGPGYALPDEIHSAPFLRGTLGMPKAGKDTGGAQLFFSLLPTPHLDGNYTVFGRIIEGIDVIEQIEIGDRIISARVE